MRAKTIIFLTLGLTYLSISQKINGQDLGTIRLGIGTKTLVNESDFATIRYIDASPSMDNLTATVDLRTGLRTLFFELGVHQQSPDAKWSLGLGLDAFAASGKSGFSGYFQFDRIFNPEASLPTELGMRMSFGSAGWKFGDAPVNGVFYVINGNTHWSDEPLEIRYKELFFNFTPGVTQYFSLGKDQLYIRASYNYGLRLSPSIELSGINTDGAEFSESVEINDPAVTLFIDGGTAVRNAPFNYNGIILSLGINLVYTN